MAQFCVSSININPNNDPRTIKNSFSKVGLGPPMPHNWEFETVCRYGLQVGLMKKLVIQVTSARIHQNCCYLTADIISAGNHRDCECKGQKLSKNLVRAEKIENTGTLPNMNKYF